MNNIYKKHINIVYHYIDLTKTVKRFNNSFKVDNYEDTVLDHTARVIFLSTEFAAYLKDKYDLQLDLLIIIRMATFHDVAETETGDMNGRIKDENNGIRDLLEKAERKYLKTFLTKEFIKQLYFDETSLEFQVMKLADKYDVYLQMIYLKDNYYKKSPQYKRIIKVILNTIDRINSLDIYNKYFKEYLSLDY